MSAAAKVSASERGQCLLCGKLVHVVSASEAEIVTWDLCKGCGLAFAAIAERVALRLVQVVARGDVVLPAGQLTLDDPDGDDGRCEAHGWTHRFAACEDVEVRRCASCGERCEDQTAAHCQGCQDRWGLQR